MIFAKELSPNNYDWCPASEATHVWLWPERVFAPVAVEPVDEPAGESP